MTAGADVTVCSIAVPRMEAQGFGVMKVDDTGRIVDFVEKPDDPPAIPGRPDMALASMGIYVFETRFLMEQLRRDAAPMLIPSVPYKVINAVAFFLVMPVVDTILLSGGMFGLREVPTEQWGGLLITLIISVVGISCSLPLGILLALGRQSKLPIVKTLCIAFIELVRAVPLITVLFMASIMLPLFMPQGTSVDKLMRALVGVTLFSSAYMAEVVRGGMQAIGRGQYEAASALGLGYWKRTAFIILPQALKHVIPGIVGNFISLLKDTSLVYIVGMKDLLEAVKTKNDAIEWASPTQSVTGYIFAAAVYWVMCFSISRYSRYWENRLNTGHKR